MKSFDYAEPRTEADVVALLSEHAGRAEVLAGGTDLVGLMKKMIIKPDLVVNIMEVESLQSIGPQEDGSFSVGAAVTLDDLLAHPYLENYPAISDAILGINSMQLQSQGTLGGEICQRPRCWFYRNGEGLLDHQGQVSEGDNRLHAILGNQGPAKFVSSSRIGPALVALDARLRIVGPGDEQRLVPAADFFVTPHHADQRETVLEPDQLLTHIILPARDDSFNATYEVRHGEGPEYPLAAAAASLAWGPLSVSKLSANFSTHALSALRLPTERLSNLYFSSNDGINDGRALRPAHWRMDCRSNVSACSLPVSSSTSYARHGITTVWTLWLSST